MITARFSWNVCSVPTGQVFSHDAGRELKGWFHGIQVDLLTLELKLELFCEKQFPSMVMKILVDERK